MLATGAVIGGYRVVRVLGSGGMGSVYLAHSPDLPRLEAVKVLSSAYSADTEFRARFLREADVAAALTHPNIVAIYRRGETAEGQLWIAMQFVDGTDADTALKGGTMTPRRAVHIVDEVAKALDYAHRRNVVHRDVKPANFLLSAQGGPSERVLLGDFGIARGLDDVGLTTTGSVVMTMAYAAPELLAGHRFDGRADIYSLGCSLFRLLTGCTPFPGGNGAAAVMMAHFHQPPPRVSDRRPGLPPALDAVIATAMAKDPARRFPTATQLADAARTALLDAAPAVSRATLPAGAVDSAPTPTPAEPRPARRGRRLRWTAATSAVAIAAAGAGAALILAERGDHRATSPTPTESAAAPPPPVPTSVAVGDLSGLLLGANELTFPLKVGGLNITSSSAALLDSSAELAETQCVSAWAPAQVAAYANSGYLGVQVQTRADVGQPGAQTTVTEALIAFPSRDMADNAVTTQVGQWQQCANRTITVTMPGGGPTPIGLGAPTGDPGGATRLLSQQPQSTPQLHCQRALASKNNVVVDLAACSPSIDGPAAAVARVIMGKVPPG